MERREMSACPADPLEASKAHVPGTEPAATKTITDYVLVVELERPLGSLLPRLGQRQRRGNTNRLGIFNDHTGDVIQLSTIQSSISIAHVSIHLERVLAPKLWWAPDRCLTYILYFGAPFSLHSHIGFQPPASLRLLR